MDANARKSVIVAAAVISQATRRKSSRQRCLPTTDTQGLLRAFPHIYQFESVRVRSLDARRNIVSVSMQG